MSYLTPNIGLNRFPDELTDNENKKSFDFAQKYASAIWSEWENTYYTRQQKLNTLRKYAIGDHDISGCKKNITGEYTDLKYWEIDWNDKVNLLPVLLRNYLNSVDMDELQPVVKAIDPTEPIKNELGQMIDIGVKRFLDEREVACQGDIKKLNAQKRNNPRIDTDPFLDEDATNMYATTGMTNHVNFLKDYVNSEKYNKQVFRFNLFYKPTPDNPLNVELIHTDKGKYIASWLPPKELRNNFRIKDGKRVPTNDNLGSLGADPYQADRAKHGTGSKMGLVGVTANNTVNLVEVERNKTFVFYNHRPNTVEEAEDDVMKLILYLSMPILPETNKDGLVRRLHKEGLRGYVISDPFKKKSELSPSNLKFGGITTSIANKGKQEQSLETYINQYVTDDIDENNIKALFLELNEMALEYAENTRTKLDGMVAWMLATAAVQHKVIKERNDIKEETKTYTRIIDLFKK